MRKLDMRALLRAADCREHDWFMRQPLEAQKEFSPLVAMRWASFVEGADESYMLWVVNDRLNEQLFTISASEHRDLIFRLLASCGSGEAYVHRWEPMPKTSSALSSNKAAKFLIECHPAASDSEIELLLSQYTRSEFRRLLDDHGIQREQAQAMVKDFDKFSKTSAQ